MFTVRGDRTVPSSRQRELISPKADPLFKYHTIHFTSGSHVKRLLQVHHYFEQVLELTVGYYSKIALVVALSSKGDMITVRKLFAKWQGRQHKDKRAHGDGSNQGTSEAGGKEIYSAVIRGLVGRNFRDSEIRPYYVATDASSGTRNNSITQMHAALELFYDLLRKVVGLAVFKNDMEAAELLLDHMIIKKKKPYVQVLHVMCREYVRRNDYPKAERIFGMLQEYGIRPRALTCNIMLRAVFRMSDVDALQHLGHRAPDAPRGSEEPEAMARQLKRQKIRRVLEYMRENETVPDQETFSTLIYGYGHMEDGYPDLKEAMVEMSREQSQIEPNLIILNSLLFAHLNHGKIKIAESILDQMLSTPHPAADQAEFGNKRPQQQVLSPFRRRRQEQMEDEVNEVDDKRDVRQSHKRAVYDKTMMMVPGKGTFHALMLAHVERGDIVGMERVLDKMIQTQRQQQEQRVKLQSMYRPRWRPMPPLVDLEGDEYTANIMLLGYLSQRDFAKVDILQKQIQSRPDWKSNFMFQDREVNMEQMIEFVKQQSSRTIVERSLQQPGRHRDPSTSWTTSNSPDSTASSRMTTAFDPLNGNGEGVLDDDIEIDVTTLSAKLRGLMKSSGTTSSTSPTSTTASTSSSSSASASPSSSSPSSSSPPFSSSQD
ncbi:hypothetical protein BGX34_002281 [Mortierella sp. NVP85]|nr:hypothetical protein BGX34_002281 [Mortierella sp. NVP85]